MNAVEQAARHYKARMQRADELEVEVGRLRARIAQLVAQLECGCVELPQGIKTCSCQAAFEVTERDRKATA